MAKPHIASERQIAGAMSGTSADGVDVAITAIGGTGLDMRCRLVHHHHRAYPESLRNEIFAFRGGDASANLARLAELGRQISLSYALATNEALLAAKLKSSDLAAIAAHGQTLFHDPPNTIQWFDPSLVAAEVGCPVISDFRRADLAAGGQGAPLVPFADYILFRHATKNRVLLNIGGIANITILRAGGSFDAVTAFDTGPGNCVSDHLARGCDPEGPGFDRDGRLAASGTPVRAMQQVLEGHAYFRRPPPKSTDGPEMIAAFDAAARHRGMDEGAANLSATAAWWTAWSVLRAIPAGTDEIIVSGGGTRNASIMTHLRDSGMTIRLIDELGVLSDAKEAIAFALLAAATLDGVPSNVPGVTGAKRAVVLGSITPKP